MKIRQLIIGDIPHQLHDCMVSIEAFAKAKGIQYQVDTELPEWAKGWDPWIVNPWYKIDCATEETRVILPDWDILISGDLNFGSEPRFSKRCDNFCYFGDDTALVETIKNNMGDRQKHKGRPMVLFEAFRKLGKAGKLDKWFLPDSEYTHLNYHKLSTRR